MGVVGRVAHAKSSDPATPKIWNVHMVDLFDKAVAEGVSNYCGNEIGRSTDRQTDR